MSQGVQLIEQSGGATPDPEPDPVQNGARARVDQGGQQRDRSDRFDLAAGGPGGEPVVTIRTRERTIQLGHEDIFLALLAIDAGLRIIKMWMEARQ